MTVKGKKNYNKKLAAGLNYLVRPEQLVCSVIVDNLEPSRGASWREEQRLLACLEG